MSLVAQTGGAVFDSTNDFDRAPDRSLARHEQRRAFSFRCWSTAAKTAPPTFSK